MPHTGRNIDYKSKPGHTRPTRPARPNRPQRQEFVRETSARPIGSDGGFLGGRSSQLKNRLSKLKSRFASRTRPERPQRSKRIGIQPIGTPVKLKDRLKRSL